MPSRRRSLRNDDKYGCSQGFAGLYHSFLRRTSILRIVVVHWLRDDPGRAFFG